MAKISSQKFYKLFLEKINNKKCLKFWLDNKDYTDWVIGNKKSIDGCVMKKIATAFGLQYCHEYFQLDGIFYDKELPLYNEAFLKKHKNSWYARSIDIIIEHENNFRGIKTEIYKLIPLYVAPLKVIITYLGGWKNNNQEKVHLETEKIIKILEKRIKENDLFSLHKNKIETLLIIGHKVDDKMCWEAFVFKNNKVKKI
ncbi:MAG: hypothetical protein PHW73_03900 [Atribacterota bacterium]|nr:hypothetical protein [Atribacterota bacterium]